MTPETHQKKTQQYLGCNFERPITRITRNMSQTSRIWLEGARHTTGCLALGVLLLYQNSL